MFKNMFKKDEKFIREAESVEIHNKASFDTKISDNKKIEDNFTNNGTPEDVAFKDDNIEEEKEKIVTQIKSIEEKCESVIDTDKEVNNIKKTSVFSQIKEFYYNNFSNEKALDKVLKIYIDVTDPNDLFDNTRIECLNMYLSNKYTVIEISNLLKWSINLNVKNIENIEKFINVDIELYDTLKNRIELFVRSSKQFNGRVDLEYILILLAIEFGYYEIMNEVYLEIIKKVLQEQSENFNIESLHYLNSKIKNLLFIENAKYWDDNSEDKGKFLKCNIIFSEKFIHCVYNDGKYSLIYFGRNVFFNVSVKNNIMSVNDTYFIVGENDKVKITDHYTNINNVFQNKINEDIKIIKQQVDDMPQNVVQVVLNYFRYFPQSILLNNVDFMTFEHLISFNNYFTKGIVDINENQRNYIIDKISNDRNYSNKIEQVKNDTYDKLVKIIGKYSDLDSAMYSSIVWSLIKKYAPQYFAEIWNKEYGSYFNESLYKSINELVYLYCRIGEINAKDINTVGIFTYYLMYNNKFSQCDNRNFIKCNNTLIDYILKECEKVELEQFENKLKRTNSKQKILYSIDDVDLMNGYEFEHFVGEIFKKMGYAVRVTKGSGDQGIDVLIEKNGDKIGVQAKCYSSNVSNKAIQEVVAGLKYYNCYKGIVVTNNYFTESAKSLAEVNNVILWDRNMLKQKIEAALNKIP